MQTLIYKCRRYSVPEGYSILKPGVKIEKGDLYFNFEFTAFRPVSDEDMHTRVCKLPDLVVRYRPKLLGRYFIQEQTVVL